MTVADEVAPRTSSRPANIRIESVRVDGFRALRNACLVLSSGTTLLLGENNTAKTSFLEALATALGQRRATDDDLHVTSDGGRVKEFVVDLALVPENGKAFDRPVGTLLGNAILRDGNDREYAAIRTRGSVSTDRTGLQLRRVFLAGWMGCDDDPVKATENSGAPPVNDRVLSLVAFTLLDASRDLEAGLHRRLSPWGRLVSELDIDPALQSSIEATLSALSEQIVGGSHVLDRIRLELGEMARALSTVDKVDLAPLPVRVGELARAIDVLVSAPQSAGLPLRMQGLGSRSLAEIMVFRAFAATLIGAGQPVEPHAVTVFEEPEAHLHPQAQVAVARVIDGIPGQRIVSTHSAHLASAADVKDVRFFRREAGRIVIRSVQGLEPDDLLKVRRLVERPYGEVLFARLVIIGDGATERAGIPVFARAHWDGTECEGKCVSVVDPGGLGQAAPLVKLLDDLGIPWLILADGDEAATQDLLTIGTRIGRALGKTSPEVVVLPDGQGLEAYLIAEGLRGSIEQGIANFYGPSALADFKATGKNALLEPEQLVLKFLRSGSRKGSYGGPIAEAIVVSIDGGGRPAIPERIRQLLERADKILERSL